MATYPLNANMSNRYPDRGYSISTRTNMEEFTSLSGYTRRKLRSRKLLRTFSFTYSSITRSMMDDIENFWNARGGTYESFTLDLSHFNLSGTCSVRFDGELAKQHVIDGNNNSWFNVSLVMVEV